MPLSANDLIARMKSKAELAWLKSRQSVTQAQQFNEEATRLNKIVEELKVEYRLSQPIVDRIHDLHRQDNHKIAAIKAIRAEYDLGLKEAKDLVEQTAERYGLIFAPIFNSAYSVPPQSLGDILDTALRNRACRQ